MNGNMREADRATLPAVARLYADNILNEPAIPPLLRDMADEVERLRLTAAEREAIEEAICDQESYIADCRKFHDPAGEQRAVQIGDTLRGLLERTGG